MSDSIKIGDPFLWSKSPETWKGEVVGIENDTVRVRRDYDGIEFLVRKDLPKQVWTYESD